jgi:heat shock protein HtpX
MNRALFLLITAIPAIPPAVGAGHAKAADGVLPVAVASLLLFAWLLQHFSGAIVLRLFRARPANRAGHPDLHRLTRGLAQRAGLHPPRLFVVESGVPNAFATGRDGRDCSVAVTRGLLQLLDEQELAGVLAHELAHLQQRKEAGPFSTAAVTSGAALLAGLVRSALVFSAGRRGAAFALATAPLAAVAASLGRRAAGGSREFAADAMGARICGNPRWLANALRKIRAAGNPASAAPSLLSSHPAVAERIHRLEALAYGAYV